MGCTCFPSFFVILFLGLCYILEVSGFRICAFNIRSFGESKANNMKIMNTLVKIIARYDVCVLQEVRDSKHVALPKLLQHLNRYDDDYNYRSVASERLGRSTYKEQYAYIYRTETATVTGQYQYPDTLPGNMDAFAREPFVVRFRAAKTAIKEFVLVPIHTSPENATKEIDALYDVFKAVKKRWNTENVMFLGDFNADCGYLAKKNRKDVRLITDPGFKWLVSDKTDTTVTDTDCAYDRIVVHGETFSRAIEPYSAQPFVFPRAYHLTDAQALEVSDHYPIEVTLKSGSHQISLSLLLILLSCQFTCS